MTNYYFTRHGESQANVDHVFAGWMDSPLTEKGRQDAEAEGERLAAEDIKFDLIVSSPLSRAQDTAKIIANILNHPHSEIRSFDELKERNAGSYEGRSTTLLKDQPKEVDAIADAGGETRIEFARRVQKALGRIHAESVGCASVLVVAHAGWYKMAISLLEHKDVDTFYVLPSPENNKVVPFPL